MATNPREVLARTGLSPAQWTQLSLPQKHSVTAGYIATAYRIPAPASQDVAHLAGTVDRHVATQALFQPALPVAATRLSPVPTTTPKASASTVGQSPSNSRPLGAGLAQWLMDPRLHPVSPVSLAQVVSGRRIDLATTQDPTAVAASRLGLSTKDLLRSGGVLYGSPMPAALKFAAQGAARDGTWRRVAQAVLAAATVDCTQWRAASSDAKTQLVTRYLALIPPSLTPPPVSAPGIAPQQALVQQAVTVIDAYCMVPTTPTAALAAMHLTCADWARTLGDTRWTHLQSVGIQRDSPLASGLTSGIDALCGEVDGAGVWIDAGDPFLGRDPTVLDAQQGGFGDCWLISILASSAWVMPGVVRARRVTGVPAPATIDTTTFDFAAGLVVTTRNELPFAPFSYNPLYTSSAAGAGSWPGLYEKAYLRWNGTADRFTYEDLNLALRLPPYNQPAFAIFGQPYDAIETTDPSAVLAFLRRIAPGPSGRCRVISNTGTGPSDGSFAPWNRAFSTYGDLGIVASHAYSVLGLIHNTSGDYVVLRNPWGYQPATGPLTLSGTWQGLVLGEQGVFALRLDAFCAFFFYVLGS